MSECLFDFLSASYAVGVVITALENLTKPDRGDLRSVAIQTILWPVVLAISVVANVNWLAEHLVRSERRK